MEKKKYTSLFIGGYFDRDLEEDILLNSKNLVHSAANKHQKMFIDAMSNHIGDFRVLSAPFIGAFPRDYKQILFKPRKKSNKLVTYINFNNLWGYRNISRQLQLKKEVKNFANDSKKNKIIFVYSPHTPFLKAAKLAKKIDQDIKICLIVPDLPQFMNLRSKQPLLYRLLKKLDVKSFYKDLPIVDYFVLLTEQMNSLINIYNKKHLVIEGMVQDDDTGSNQQKVLKDSPLDPLQTEHIILTYTGSLHKKFGILNLLEAFTRTTDIRFRLNICGYGDSQKDIESYVKKDDRITYYGQVSSEKASFYQMHSNVLINPRQNTDEFTQFSFPSKTMEYMLQAKPIIAYKLDGIPNEYDNYLDYVVDNSIQSLTEKINEVMLEDPIIQRNKGLASYNFVTKHKTNINAVNKIFEMID